MNNQYQRMVASLLFGSLLMASVGGLFADDKIDAVKTITVTQSETQRVKEENEELRAKIAELELRAKESGASAKKIDATILLIEARSVTPKLSSEFLEKK